MAELRWTLLGIGALFVLGLLLWERYKRGRAASGKVRAADSASAPASASADDAVDAASADADQRDSARDDQGFDADGVGSVTTAVHRGGHRDTRRDTPRELPIVDIDAAQAASAARVKASPESSYDVEEGTGDYVSQPLDTGEAAMRGMRVESMSGAEDAAGRAEQWIAAAGVRSLRSEDLIVDWPADDQRSILALRVEARGTERIGGRTVRQSLLGEGFVFGKFDIFHLPLADGRVILSAASLTKPGSFSLSSIDAQTFLGLNLFAVLPGPLSGVEALDRLVASGRLLAQRMRADLLDTQGQPLTEARLLEMRARLANSRPAMPAAAAAAQASTPAASGEPV